MEIIDINSWDDFSNEINQLRTKYEKIHNPAKLLFRGVGDSNWELDTTLERKIERPFLVYNYLRLVCRFIGELETYMKTSWNISHEAKIDNFKGGTNPPLPFFDYLVFLRHHGFPSPLLDWTESPYIAAYFAFSEKIKNADRVAIYAYIERIPGYGKGGCVGAPLITVWKPTNKMHIRHFAQKASYTTATRLDDNAMQIFCHHNEVFKKEKKQDVITKITIPVSERIKALKELSDYNINHFTLFQTQDSLVKTMAIRELDIKWGQD